MRYPLLLLVFCGLIGNSLHAQDRLLEKGNEKYQNYAFSPAIDIYKKVLDKGYESAVLLKRLGNAYYFNADYQQAAEIYGKLVTNYPEDLVTEPEYYFRYAQALRSEGNYQDSEEYMARFREMVRPANVDRQMDPLDEIKANSGRYELGPFEYNSRYSDFAPAFYQKGLIFSSDRDTGNLAKYRHSWNARAFLEMYKVNADSSSANRVLKLEGVNTRWHESTSVTSKQGDTLYFTRNNTRDGKFVTDATGKVRLKIYRTVKGPEGWTAAESLPFNDDAYSTAHPALSPDGKFLYFASDRPGGRGASDLWRVRRQADGSYGTPENLGAVINTPERETFPFISSENVLYFASDGHVGLGGLDVFATSLEGSLMNGPVKNVGAPVNSPKDDFTFIFVEGTRKGYFASNREGGMGSDDIYSFVETRALDLACIQQISGTVRDKITNELLAGATIKVIDEENQEIRSTISSDEGTYALSCNCNQGNFVRALRQGYVPAEEFLVESQGKPRIIDFYLEPETVTAGFGDDLAKLLQLSTIYFDYNKFNIRPDAEVEIQKVIAAMEKYPSLKLQVNSHTDSRGSDTYNLWLSKKRAEATVNYMIEKGITADRLRSEGYGETRLVNDCGNGADCTDEEFERNRRSEFIILQ